MNTEQTLVPAEPTVLYINFDADGCMFNDDYHTPEEFAALTPEQIATDPLVVNCNPLFWAYLQDVLERHPQIKTIRYIPFSSRQSLATDIKNCKINSTESYFLAMEKFVEETKRLHANLDVAIDPILVPDIQSILGAGSSFKHARAFDYSLNPTPAELHSGTAAELNKDAHLESKIDLIYLHTHRACAQFRDQKILMLVLDNQKESIIDKIKSVYQTEQGKKAISKNMTVELHHYGEQDEQTKMKEPEAVLRFTGEFNFKFEIQLNEFWKNCTEANFDNVLSQKIVPSFGKKLRSKSSSSVPFSHRVERIDGVTNSSTINHSFFSSSSSSSPKETRSEGTRSTVFTFSPLSKIEE